VHGGLQEVVGVEAAFHEGLKLIGAAEGDGGFGGFGFSFCFDDGIGVDIEADLCARAFMDRRTDECWLDEAGDAASTAPRRRLQTAARRPRW